MANVPHSGLTGLDLHESKGTAAAAANTVFVADGAGSGTYQKVPGAAIAGFGNPFGSQLFQCIEVGQNNYFTGWTKRPMNSILTNEISGSISSGQMTLPAGTYFVDAYSSEYFNNFAAGQTVTTMARLRNITASTTLVTSNANNWSSTTTSVSSATILRGRFTLAATSVLEYQSYTNSSFLGLGASTGSGEAVSPTNVCIWKIS